MKEPEILSDVNESLLNLKESLYHVRSHAGYNPKYFTALVTYEDCESIGFLSPWGYHKRFKDSIKTITPVEDLHWVLDFLTEMNRRKTRLPLVAEMQYDDY